MNAKATESKAVETPAVSAAKEKFESNASAPSNHNLAVAIARRVVDRLESATVSTAISDIKGQIQELLSAKDTDIAKIIELTEKLKSSDTDQQTKNTKAQALTKQFTLAEVLVAFKPQYEELVYTVANELLDRANVLATSGGKGASTGKKKGLDHIIQNTKGETVTLPSRAGRASSNLSQDRAVWDFLNLQIETEDGKEVFVPGTLNLNEGGEIPTTRKTIIESLFTGNVKELQGFTIRKDEGENDE
ncbi:hypothetical protein [Pseudomonas orientalis]|uniref:hypothetical protein n=1 Tax=Pseudomonas orientalis TaxID=76758 RepID=UPI0012FFF389|nr:hypothetical protein [Pseudomonas orientalis]